jgi:hypothetical protein
MNWSFWSDEDRWFVPRRLGLGYSLNLKYLAKRLGWIKRAAPAASSKQVAPEHDREREESRQDRLRRQADESKYEVQP